MDRIVMALIGVVFVEAMGVLFVLGRSRLAKNFPTRALDGRPATARSVAASGIGFMIGGAIVLIAVFVFVAAGS